MAESLELPLPELLLENFKRGWTCFEFIATAKGWDAPRQLVVIPTLQDRAGVKEDPLVASKQFNQRNQGPEEKVKDFASTLKRLFKDAYTAELMTSAVLLLQRFLTGLRPEIGRQLLLRNRPTTFTDVLKDVEEIEYALAFNGLGEGILCD